MDRPTSVPVFRSLVEPILIAGAPRGLAIANATLALALAVGLRLWAVGLVAGLIGHGLAVVLARSDPDGMAVGRRHLRLPAHLEV